MMVTFVSQCEKKALNRTRRVLDAFANRIGDKTWQTIITEDGLLTVKTLLRKTATRSTAVACHWIRSRSRSELVWVVGNRKKFNPQGVVPVNSTKINSINSHLERGWRTTEIIAIATAIAGLFHDFGKANDLFQNRLDPELKIKKLRFEPYRHEWISLRLFQAFVGKDEDKQWLSKLATVNAETEKQILKQLVIDNPQAEIFDNPFEKLPQFANVIAWLIVSHHRLPAYPPGRNTEPSLKSIENWLNKDFDDLWNSVNSINHDWNEKSSSENWNFSKGIPLISRTWQQKATWLSKRALNCIGLLEENWFNQKFMMHISRLILMLSDHYYSAMGVTSKWQDNNYQAYANTDQYNQYKQKLDEHNVAVGYYAFSLAKSLPHFRDELPAVEYNKALANGLEGGKDFLWQDKAYKQAQAKRNLANNQGFFGINMGLYGHR